MSIGWEKRKQHYRLFCDYFVNEIRKDKVSLGGKIIKHSLIVDKKLYLCCSTLYNCMVVNCKISGVKPEFIFCKFINCDIKCTNPRYYKCDL